MQKDRLPCFVAGGVAVERYITIGHIVEAFSV